MTAIINNLRKIVFLPVGLLFFSTVYAFDGDSIIANCNFYGTVQSNADCPYSILLDNGTLLEPESWPEGDLILTPLRAKISYEILDSVTGPCGSGLFVRLTCFQPVYDTIVPDCFTGFSYFLLRCDSLILYEQRCGPYTFQFSSYASNAMVSALWDFGDGSESDEFSPVHEFPGPGSYEVTLTAVLSDSCIATYSGIINIADEPDCRAAFAFYDPVDCFDLMDCYSTTVAFVDYSSGSVDEWYWDFGDGSVSGEQHPVHDYDSAGRYLVCLTITSYEDSCSDTYCVDVSVGISSCHAMFDYCSYTTANNPDSSASDTVSSGEYIIGFRNLSEGIIDYYWWDFGDGGYSTDRNAVHQYASPGVYSVCLSIGSYAGCYDTYCSSVNVGDVDCSVDFTYEITIPYCEGFDPAYLFIPELSHPYWSITWDFGDGNYSSDEVSAHFYQWDGVYNVCVEVVFNDGCTATQCKDVDVLSWAWDSVFYEKCIAGVDPVTKGFEAELFPVPSRDEIYLTIECLNDGKVTIEFVNMLGQVQLRSENHLLSAGENTVIVLSDLETGTYICCINSDKGLIYKKISVIK